MKMAKRRFILFILFFFLPSHCCENLSTILVSIRAFEVPMWNAVDITRKETAMAPGVTAAAQGKKKNNFYTFEISCTPNADETTEYNTYEQISQCLAFRGNDFLMILNLFPTVRM